AADEAPRRSCEYQRELLPLVARELKLCLNVCRNDQGDRGEVARQDARKGPSGERVASLPRDLSAGHRRRHDDDGRRKETCRYDACHGRNLRSSQVAVHELWRALIVSQRLSSLSLGA